MVRSRRLKAMCHHYNFLYAFAANNLQIRMFLYTSNTDTKVSYPETPILPHWCELCDHGSSSYLNPVVANSQLDPNEQTSLKSGLNFKHFHWRNAIENVLGKMSVVLSRPQCANALVWCENQAVGSWRDIHMIPLLIGRYINVYLHVRASGGQASVEGLVRCVRWRRSWGSRRRALLRFHRWGSRWDGSRDLQTWRMGSCDNNQTSELQL